MIERRLKRNLVIVTYGLILYFFLLNLELFNRAFSKIIFFLTPFIYGFVVAYFMNWPYMFFYNKVYKKVGLEKVRKMISVLSAYMIAIGVIGFLLVIVIPHVVGSFYQLVGNFSSYVNLLSEYIIRIEKDLNLNISPKAQEKVKEVLDKMINLNFDSYIYVLLDYVKSFAILLYNWLIGIIVSIYFIFNKEKFINQAKKLAYVCLPEQYYDATISVLRLSHEIFGRFIVGKLLDSLIIGMLCFIGTTLLSIPYAALISVLVGVTNIIPFFGPFFGAIPSIFILLMVDPLKACWFGLFILALQQVDGNIIGPKILGGSVGISGLFIMFSVIVGGGLFGIPGMLLGVPVFVVIYNAIRGLVNGALRHKGCGKNYDNSGG